MIQDKMAKADQERIKALLKETITLLCKNGLTYSSEFSVEALIGITLDKEDVFLVNIKETIAHPNAEKESDSEGEVEERGRRPSHSSSSTPRRDTSNPPTPQRDSRDAGSPAQTPRSFSRQLAERKRAASQDNSNTSLPNITESFGWDGSSPAKRSRDYKDEITDVVVIKEESGSEDDKDSCMISSGPPQLNQGSMGQDFRLDQSQLIPVPGNVLPGCSAWSTMPGTQGAALSLQGPPPPGMGVQGQPLNLLGGEPPNTSSDGSETELVPGSGVYIPTTVYHSLNQEYFPKGSKLVRRLVHTIFPDDYELANSSCLGKRGDSCHKGLDQRKVEAIKVYFDQKFPQTTISKFTKWVNNCCCDARQKIKQKLLLNPVDN